MRKVVKRVKRDSSKTRPKLSDKQLYVETMRSATRRRLRQQGYLFAELHRPVPHGALGDMVFPDGGRPVFVKYASKTRNGLQPLSEISEKLDSVGYVVIIVDDRAKVDQVLLPYLAKQEDRAAAMRKFQQAGAKVVPRPPLEIEGDEGETPESETETEQQAEIEEGVAA